MMTILSVIFFLLIVSLSLLLYFLMKRRPSSKTSTSCPTAMPTASPTSSPTSSPTASPTASPTSSPTAKPTSSPTASPTSSPTSSPTATPTSSPTSSPTATPTSSPTASPTARPTATPTATPTSSPTSSPTATPTSTPGPSPDFYEGDGKASTTYFTSGESKGAGACGGCVYPGIKNMPPDYNFQASNFDNLYDQMKNIVTDGAHWTMAAASEAMMAPYCPGSVGMGCTGRSDPQGSTASAPCGTCWRLRRNGNNKILNVVVADACPCGNSSVCPTTAGGADNSKWCLAEPGVPNSVGMYNHFDVWNATDPVLEWPSTGQDGDPVSFENIPCPDNISNLMAASCCGTYYDGSQGGSPQGCPNICGPQYTCPSS